MRKKYTMISDIFYNLEKIGYKGSGLFSRKTYLLEEKLGERLIKIGKAKPYEPKRFITVTDPYGKTSTLSWGDYLKRKKMMI